MKQKELQYRGYVGSVQYSEEDGVFHGKLIGIRDLVSYEGETMELLEKDFRDAVDFYLDDLNDGESYDRAMEEHKKNPLTYSLEKVEKMIEEDTDAKH